MFSFSPGFNRVTGLARNLRVTVLTVSYKLPGSEMSTHAYSRCWLHLIWETLRREPMLDERAAAKASTNLLDYSREKGIYMRINFFNADHTHALIDLPTNLTIEQVIQLLKGSSSHWINENRLVRGRFAWGRGYGAFSVSQSDVDRVSNYIANQGNHHRKKTFEDEYQLFVRRYGLEWRDEGNR